MRSSAKHRSQPNSRPTSLCSPETRTTRIAVYVESLKCPVGLQNILGGKVVFERSWPIWPFTSAILDRQTFAVVCRDRKRRERRIDFVAREFCQMASRSFAATRRPARRYDDWHQEKNGFAEKVRTV